MPTPLINQPEPEDPYFASGAWGSTSAKKCLISPRAGRDAFDGVDEKDSPALSLGRVVDAYWTGGEVIQRPSGLDGRTKDGKAWLAAHEGKLVANEDQLRKLSLINDRMPDPIHRLMAAAKDAKACQRVFRTQTEGVWVQARFDLLVGHHGYDLKTTSKPLEDFARSAVTYGYPFQMAWYAWVASLCGHVLQGFRFIVCETESPYRTAMFTPDSDFLAFGEAQRIAAFDVIKRSTVSGDWSDNTGAERILTLPTWATKPNSAGQVPEFGD
jgi:hypothetical protein